MGEHNSRIPPAPQDGPRHIGPLVHHRQQTLFQGPIPPVEDFAGYERILPGAADRILKMAENQAGHRQTLERRALNGDLIKAMMGTILAYLTFGGSMTGALYLLANDKPLYSLATFITAIGAAFGPKIYADFIQPKRGELPVTSTD